jgi:putative transposase
MAVIRKQVKHYSEPGHVHELTFSCYQRRPLLTNDHWRGLLAEAVNRAMARHDYRLLAFVFMPEHVHLLVYPEEGAAGLPELLNAIKRPYSYRIKQLLMAAGCPLISQLTVHQRPGVKTFRYWQEGPGYDRNITNLETLRLAIDYIHENPVKRGLCQQSVDWKWSSARWHLSGGGIVEEGLPLLRSLPWS